MIIAWEFDFHLLFILRDHLLIIWWSYHYNLRIICVSFFNYDMIIHPEDHLLIIQWSFDDYFMIMFWPSPHLLLIVLWSYDDNLIRIRFVLDIQMMISCWTFGNNLIIWCLLFVLYRRITGLLSDHQISIIIFWPPFAFLMIIWWFSVHHLLIIWW